MGPSSIIEENSSSLMSALDEVVLFKSMKSDDDRGYFKRVFEKSYGLEIVQSSISYNRQKGTLRGLHFQKTPSRESKLITCISGEIFDCVVDVRVDSRNYGRVQSFYLSEDKGESLLIPPGFAHGFQTLEGDTRVLYQMSDFHDPALASTISWNDPQLSIRWPLTPSVISTKDQETNPWPKKY